MTQVEDGCDNDCMSHLQGWPVLKECSPTAEPLSYIVLSRFEGNMHICMYTAIHTS